MMEPDAASFSIRKDSGGDEMTSRVFPRPQTPDNDNLVLRSTTESMSQEARMNRLYELFYESNAQVQYDLREIQSITFKGIIEDKVHANRLLRPIAWRLLLGVIVENYAQWDNVLADQRAQYRLWKREFMGNKRRRNSDQMESYTPMSDENETESMALKEGIASIIGNNGNQSQYHSKHDTSLLKEIEKDVSRTHSSLSFFSPGSMAQQWMLSILFIYAKLNPEVGYVQGMNEILAPILFTFGTDTSEEWASETETDAFFAFSSVMKAAKILYMKLPEDATKSGVDTQMARLTVLLRQHDALLWQHLNSIGLSPEYYSFRWYMTILSREFPMEQTLRIWDALLSDPKRFSFLHYTNCALLRSQKSALLQHGFGESLKVLQQLPVEIDIEKLLEDAERLRDMDRLVDRRSSLGLAGAKLAPPSPNAKLPPPSPNTKSTPSSPAKSPPSSPAKFAPSSPAKIAPSSPAKFAPSSPEKLVPPSPNKLNLNNMISSDRKQHVVLYFDVNKTVIMLDPVQGKDVDNIINDLLTESAFGKIIENQWIWNGKKPSMHENCKEDSSQVSYGTFLRIKYPQDDTDRTKAHSNKQLRKVLRRDFTSKGHPGEFLASEFEEVAQKLLLPLKKGCTFNQEAMRQAGFEKDAKHYFLLPSFVHFIQFLHTNKYSFNLIFRTYGDDLFKIAQEFNCLCEGKHPFFHDLIKEEVIFMDGRDGTPDRRIHFTSISTFGTFFRSDEVTALILGTFDQPKDHLISSHITTTTTMTKTMKEVLQMFYDDVKKKGLQDEQKNIQILYGMECIYEYLSSSQVKETQKTLAFRDFYPYWFHRMEHCKAGKLFLLDLQQEYIEEKIHAIFFDDNILHEDPHIVDVRNVLDGQNVDFDYTKDIHLLRVEPLQAIRDLKYFIKRFQLAQQNKQVRKLVASKS